MKTPCCKVGIHDWWRCGFLWIPTVFYQLAKCDKIKGFPLKKTLFLCKSTMNYFAFENSLMC